MAEGVGDLGELVGEGGRGGGGEARGGEDPGNQRSGAVLLFAGGAAVGDGEDDGVKVGGEEGHRLPVYFGLDLRHERDWA